MCRDWCDQRHRRGDRHAALVDGGATSGRSDATGAKLDALAESVAGRARHVRLSWISSQSRRSSVPPRTIAAEGGGRRSRPQRRRDRARSDARRSTARRPRSAVRGQPPGAVASHAASCSRRCGATARTDRLRQLERGAETGVGPTRCTRSTKAGLKAFADGLRDEVNADGVRVAQRLRRPDRDADAGGVHEFEGRRLRAEVLMQPAGCRRRPCFRSSRCRETAEVTEIEHPSNEEGCRYHESAGHGASRVHRVGARADARRRRS